MKVDSFRDMYIAELQELRSVEAQLIEALPKMADMAGHAELKQAIRSHLEEEKQTDDKLTGLAKRMVNPDAAAT
jgi:ferritin-like metal-binding protein YciE